MSYPIRNIAIIAHVDHGKTTLVDQLLKQSGTFRENQEIAERVMDSGDIERERGITIAAKNTAVIWKGVKINIVDTPGHSDFGGEVERILKMVNGVILLVDAAEGPLPQTRFVLRKSLNLGYRPIVVINKIDRHDARAEDVLNEVFDLFVNLEATDEQLDFPVLYAVGIKGIANFNLDDLGTDLNPLFETVVKHVPEPERNLAEPFKMLVSNVEWNDYVGRIAIGRVEQGVVNRNQQIVLLDRNGNVKQKARVTKLFSYAGLEKIAVDKGEAGDIIALAGYEDTNIGDSLVDEQDLVPVPYYDIDLPTISMFFRVNDSPFAGLEGKFVTSNQIRDRLIKELRTNVSLKVSPTESPDVYRVAGRGELQLAILIESMRREGYEFSVSRPEVIFKEEGGQVYEPVEEVIINVPEEYSSRVIDILLMRKGIMESMSQELENVRLAFKVPSRGLIGFRNDVLTETKGMALIHQQFYDYEPHRGEMPGRKNGSIVSLDKGQVTSYALEGLQDRGQFMVEIGVEVYAGQVVGINNRSDDLLVNVVKRKNLTNHRAAQTADTVRINTPLRFSLEQCLEYIEDDELLEVTPKSLRIRKKYLDHNERKRQKSTANV
ncbi:MAG: translational GTPase TypA [Candidatus Cyclonatronum sp.]|uniref:translational GTPase TypA n=1 Tax=Cyclonatronum sp. TaxID=3024185 RepID=UPI0025BAE485|nr:translational GTPase TypA [Cyclonatronum sp.]MCC5935423.1 translational GTPase TypA [Balneolales bacterium]MCH8488093.1 translational GTPase TypA [Cyclonatronum sp.]